MNTFSVFYVLSGIFYSVSISFIYCSFLTPKDNIRHPKAVSAVIMSLICVFAVIDYRFVTYGLLVSMMITLLLFKDSFGRRIAGFIIAYMTQLTTELCAVNLYNLLHFLIFKKFPAARTGPASGIGELFGTVSLICICGTMITAILSKYINKWLYHFRTSAISMMGLPLIITMVLYNILIGKLGTPQFYPYLIVVCFLYLLCYFPVALGFRRIHRQEKERAALEKHRALVQEQLAYSQQMEEEYRQLRKWNHDISNHIIALSYLLDNGKYQEGADYLEILLSASKTVHNPSDQITC
ncbi:MAG: hypothetical protein Q4D16_05135 [Eubacteriales bacterium]|nr:hypothetical protein [Eubacteriales bacterium]